MEETAMRRMLAGGVLIGTLALVGAASPRADHAYVFGGATFYHGSGPAVAEYTSPYVPCTASGCTVSVAIGKRDYGRFLKWCGSDNREIVVAAGSFGNYTECAAPKPWRLTVNVAMRSANQALTTHAQPVNITVMVTP
jgi:hypothetical protein